MLFINWNDLKIIKNAENVTIVNERFRTWVVISFDLFKKLIMNDGKSEREIIDDLRSACASIATSVDEIEEMLCDLLEREILFDDSNTCIRKDEPAVQTARSGSFYLTNSCNFNCVHCYKNANNNIADMNTAQVKFALKRLNDEFMCSRISFTGGEPLLRTDLIEILTYARSVFSFVQLQTNGSLLTEEVVSQIAPLVDVVRIGLDGSTSAINDPVRGTGSFEMILAGIKLARKHNIKTIVSTTILKTNIDDIVNIKKLCERYGADFVMTDYLHMGRGVNNDLGYEDYTPNGDNYNYEEYGVCSERCGAFTQRITIDSDGTLYPCDELMYPEFVLGNILKDDYHDINNCVTARQLKGRTVNSLEHCKQCNVKYFCNGLCPGRAYARNGDMWSQDPRCEYKKRELNKLIFGSH